MDEFSSNQATDSHTLHLNSNSNQVAADDATQTQTQIRSQSAAGDGSQAEIITMDASLYKAAADGNIHALQQFPEVDLQIQSSPKENSVLHIAAQFGQLRCVKWMLEFAWCSSLLHRQNLKGDTPLHLAAREGHLLVLRALMDAAKLLPLDIESGIGAEKAMLRLTNKGGDTALHEAVRYNHSEVVKFLIMEDPEFAYSENIDGGTPLYMAAERGFGKLVEIIIDNTRTSPGYTGFTGRTVLHAAVIHNNTEMTKKILEWKPALTKEVDENGWSPLHYAACRGCNTTIIRQLLDKSDKSVPNLRIKDGNLTALHIAARDGRMKIVDILASHSPDCCEQVDDKGKFFFHFAMMKKKAYASGDLLRNRWLRVTGLINEKDGEGDTPLHPLASHQVFDPKFVGDDKVDRMAFNNQRFTAMDIYSKAKNASLVILFL
ncbi:ankyrin-3-like [Vitis riparia]|uniref:ankyrin-3-like n=1 Tax=Vitis riparia TaxID=96939 RepID=UPI00155A22FE|nr:ankyrin-3-like [Vitis riparia]